MLKNKKLKSSEAVFGFAAWLTTREKSITMSSKHDSAKVANLVGKFNKKNNLQDPRDKWEKILKFPNEKK